VFTLINLCLIVIRGWFIFPLTFEVIVPDTMTHIHSDYSLALWIGNRVHFSFIPL